MTILKIAFMWSPFDWEIMGGNGLYNFSYCFILPFVLVGIFVTIARKMLNSLVLFMPIIYSQGIGVVFDASPRYRLPIEPFIIIIGSIGLVYLYQKFMRHKAVFYASVSGFFLVNLWMYFNSDAVNYVVRKGFELIGLW
jgi:prepilin signal peptidase PulO-like enzyme (type II secretory pathway)